MTTDTIIQSESVFALRGGAMCFVETTYRDADESVLLVIGENRTRMDDSGSVLSFEHVDLFRMRWQ